MKWILAMVVLAGCAASAFSRLARITQHRAKGGPMMRRRIFGSIGVAAASLGWAAAVLPLVGVIHRGPRADWVLLIFAAAVSVFMGWTLTRADLHTKIGGAPTDRQREAAEELARIRQEALSRGPRKP